MILFLLVLAGIFYAAERYSLVHGLEGILVKTETDRIVVEPGEPFLWTLTVKNGNRRMAPYLEIREMVPAGLFLAETGEPAEGKDGAGVRSVLYLKGHEQARLSRRVFLLERGRYFFRGCRLEAGDFLGLKTVSDTFPELAELVVKPRRMESVKLSELLGGFLGETSVDRSLWEDPVLTVGFRDYTGREPFRSIHWLQSAKSGRLVVRQYDHTLDQTCTVLFNTDGEGEGLGKRLEFCCRAARQVCEELEKRKIAYDFQTNGVIAGAMGEWRTVGSGLGAGHLETVLEGLGRMTDGFRETGAEWLWRIGNGINSRTGMILITPVMGAGLSEAVLRLEERFCGKVLVVNLSEMEGEET